jgi:prophage antirepressor-like protein
MNELQIFNSEEFGDIRTVTIDNEPMFCLSDVCKALGLTQPSKVKERLNEKGVSSIPTLTAGGEQKLLYINESNLYKTIFQSRKESAERFTDWVTSEVLPAIRKTGAYKKPMTTDQKIQLLAQGNVELTEKIEKVNDDLQEFKKDMPLLVLECQKITRAKNQKVVPLMGGKNAPAYKNKSLMHKVYSDVDAQLRREFGVNTYKAIKRSQCDLAIRIIESYKLPMFLQKEIDAENAQMRLPV